MSHTNKTTKDYKHLSTKSNWRITQLSNGYYQAEVSKETSDREGVEYKTWHPITRRETIDGITEAINGSIKHYKKRLEVLNEPVRVIKSF